jgi:hypothetical protein
VICTFTCLECIFGAFADSEGICSLEGRCDQASIGGISWRRWDRAKRDELVEIGCKREGCEHTTLRVVTNRSRAVDSYAVTAVMGGEVEWVNSVRDRKKLEEEA